MRLYEFSESLLDTPSHHIVIGLSGVPGAGKTTIIQQLITDCLDEAGYVRSLTTRPRRSDDRGDEYEYITEVEFSLLEEQGAVTWKVGAHGKFYGNTYEQFFEAMRYFRFSLIAITPETILKICGIIPRPRLRLFHLVAPNQDEQTRRLAERGECQTAIEHRVITSRTWERQVESLADPQTCPIIFISQGTVRDMYMEFISSLDLPTR
ncbi:MAG: hypothetical protein WD970_00845 [Patescibacteria group bacterium]